MSKLKEDPDAILEIVEDSISDVNKQITWQKQME